ncbi:MAG: sigma-70 family RNA polymerase sigma factor [Pseudomonadota bacterium]
MTDETEDDRLAARAAAGDAAAFAALLECHYARVHRIGWRLLGSAEEADDLAQDVCAGLAHRIAGWRGEAAFTTWLTTLTLNAARDRLRARGRRVARDAAWAETDALARAGSEAREADVSWLRGALAALPEDLRETAVLVLDNAMPHAEAGRALGISAGTVSWRMSEIRRRLKAFAATEEGAIR